MKLMYCIALLMCSSLNAWEVRRIINMTNETVTVRCVDDKYLLYMHILHPQSSVMMEDSPIPFNEEVPFIEINNYFTPSIERCTRFLSIMHGDATYFICEARLPSNASHETGVWIQDSRWLNLMRKNVDSEANRKCEIRIHLNGNVQFLQWHYD